MLNSDLISTHFDVQQTAWSLYRLYTNIVIDDLSPPMQSFHIHLMTGSGMILASVRLDLLHTSKLRKDAILLEETPNDQLQTEKSAITRTVQLYQHLTQRQTSHNQSAPGGFGERSRQSYSNTHHQQSEDTGRSRGQEHKQSRPPSHQDTYTSGPPKTNPKKPTYNILTFCKLTPDQFAKMTLKEFRLLYKTLAREYHPDRDGSEDQFKYLNKIYNFFGGNISTEFNGAEHQIVFANRKQLYLQYGDAMLFEDDIPDPFFREEHLPSTTSRAWNNARPFNLMELSTGSSFNHTDSYHSTYTPPAVFDILDPFPRKDPFLLDLS
jgi:hypothetical protein